MLSGPCRSRIQCICHRIGQVLLQIRGQCTRLTAVLISAVGIICAHQAVEEHGADAVCLVQVGLGRSAWAARGSQGHPVRGVGHADAPSQGLQNALRAGGCAGQPALQLGREAPPARALAGLRARPAGIRAWRCSRCGCCLVEPVGAAAKGLAPGHGLILGPGGSPNVCGRAGLGCRRGEGRRLAWRPIGRRAGIRLQLGGRCWQRRGRGRRAGNWRLKAKNVGQGWRRMGRRLRRRRGRGAGMRRWLRQGEGGGDGRKTCGLN
mmetsp:Transcript_18135/g.52846  ORF Transcript_18135/g.52846 Transcript_18135/m.52846 type:complete len:264 (+) Transcript_18135:61-852(+)